MNCIFLCVFHQEEYVRMLYLLLESLFIYGSPDILIYTSTPFMNKIKESHLYNEKIHFAINDYDDIHRACRARLDLFQLPISKYEKILYLDTDILIKGDINKVFDVCTEDILYVLEEGDLKWNPHIDFWGKNLFGDELNDYEDTTAFISGILLFKNCERMKDLFCRINEDIETRSHDFHDQPFIVYNAFKYKCFNNKLLKSLVVNNDMNIHSDKVIHHFPGHPGVHQHKIVKMKRFLDVLKDFTITNNVSLAKAYIDEHLLPIIDKTGEPLEGNIFMLHHTTVYTDVFENKIKNIGNLTLNKNIKKVLEIGFNSGFSALLMLLSNPELHITCIDLGEHSYVLPCFEKLKKTFGKRIDLIIGDSRQVLPDDKYDLIHIDGGHSTDVAISDIVNSYKLSKQGTIIVMNDYDFNNLHKLWDIYRNEYNLKPLDISIYNSPHHDIRYALPALPV